MKALVSTRVFANGKIAPATILMENGKIAAVTSTTKIPQDAQVENVGDLLVIPGLVDSHVHINEPGRTEWEGFATATQAAAAGGITTVVDMPLNCLPVTTTISALETKLAELSGKLWVDAAFHGGVVPEHLDQLEPMMKAGIKTFKAFMIDSGIPEFSWSNEATLEKAMSILAKGGGTLLVHAEVDLPTAPSSGDGSDQSFATFLASRPAKMEDDAIAMIIRLSEKTGCRTHIVHLSSASAVSMLVQARARGVRVTAETCPHYLTMSSENIPNGDGRYKCMPPIREHDNRMKLWQALQSRQIEMVVSDHSPCTPALKKLDVHNLRDAWGGISSLQFGLSLIWSEIRRRGMSMADLVRWMCEAPAELVGLEGRKGRIQKGYDADLVVFDPDATTTIAKDKIYHRHKETPYEGWQVHGKVKQTWLRGMKIYNDGTFQGIPRGEKLL